MIFFELFKKNNDLFRFFLISSSKTAGITYSIYHLKQKDITNLPYPEDELDLELSPSETIVRDDVLNYLMKSGQDSKNSPLNQLANNNELTQFGEVFCKILKPIYEKDEMSWQVDSFNNFGSSIIYTGTNVVKVQNLHDVYTRMNFPYKL